MPAQRDGPDRCRRALVRELAAFVLEMTLPAIAVSVIDAAATGRRTPGTKVIYGASASQVTVRVYDPNSGRNDGIYIRFDPRAPAKPTTFAHKMNIARPVRGFFQTAYAPATPPAS